MKIVLKLSRYDFRSEYSKQHLLRRLVRRNYILGFQIGHLLKTGNLAYYTFLNIVRNYC